MRAVLSVFGLVAALLISGCTQEAHTCEPPYIVKGIGCCLDQNGNGICDSEEAIGNDTVKNYRAYSVHAYIQHDSPEPDSWKVLPPTPARHYDGYQIYNYQPDEKYYDGGWLLLYSDYTEETITCLLKQYHDSALESESSLKLTGKGYSSDVNGVSVRALFLKDDAPRQVRYEIECRGDGSGIEFTDTYVVSLRPP